VRAGRGGRLLGRRSIPEIFLGKKNKHWRKGADHGRQLLEEVIKLKKFTGNKESWRKNRPM